MIVLMHSSPINQQEVIDVATEFLDSYLQQNLPTSFNYHKVELRLAASNGRRLQNIATIPVTGEVQFNLISSPESTIINKYVVAAFSSSKDIFLETLRGSEIAGNESLIDVHTTDSRVHNDFTLTHLIIVVSCILAVLGFVAVSYIWKRSQANYVKKEFLREAEGNDEYRCRLDFDDIFRNEIDPKPIEISNDSKAVQRMLARSRHDRMVMNKANQKLHELPASSFERQHEEEREVRFLQQLESSFRNIMPILMVSIDICSTIKCLCYYILICFSNGVFQK